MYHVVTSRVFARVLTSTEISLDCTTAGIPAAGLSQDQRRRFPTPYIINGSFLRTLALAIFKQLPSAAACCRVTKHIRTCKLLSGQEEGPPEQVNAAADSCNSDNARSSTR